jgi:hypothetical protein
VGNRWNLGVDLTASDLTPILERVKSANVPVLVKLKKACDERGIVVADSDGFAVMIVERDGRVSGSSPAKSNLTSMRFGYLVSGDALAKGPFVALGLAAETRSPACRPVEEALLSRGGAASIITLPGGFEGWLVKAKAEKITSVVRPRDPGAAVLRLMVSDVEAAAQALQQVQASIVSAGGTIQTLPPAGLRATILRAPDDLFIQVGK